MTEGWAIATLSVALLRGERPSRCGGDAGSVAGGGHQHVGTHPATVHDPRTQRRGGGVSSEG